MAGAKIMMIDQNIYIYLFGMEALPVGQGLLIDEVSR
jgi:hypothetical protein